MKINFYILLILLLAFSFGNAQSEKTSIEIDSNSKIFVSEMNKEIAVKNSLNVESKEDNLLIDASQIKEAIVRTNSDIRVYFNRERKVDNIKLLFPEINKAVKA